MGDGFLIVCLGNLRVSLGEEDTSTLFFPDI